MAERLKQIWAGFEETTTRHLTGKGVDNIVTPHRTDYADEDRHLLPEDFEDPSTRAFTALHEELAAQQKKFGRKGKKRSKPNESDASASMTAQAPGEDELIKGLKATAMRTERSDIDYEAFLVSDAGKSVLKKTRKKRFGIF